MPSETMCFDPTCDCCRIYGRMCRELEEEIEQLRARLRGLGTPEFKGAALGLEDEKRLEGQFERIWAIMRDGEYHTIREVAAKTGDPAQSVARQMGHIRSKARGGHVLEREHRGHGLLCLQGRFRGHERREPDRDVWVRRAKVQLGGAA